MQYILTLSNHHTNRKHTLLRANQITNSSCYSCFDNSGAALLFKIDKTGIGYFSQNIWSNYQCNKGVSVKAISSYYLWSQLGAFDEINWNLAQSIPFSKQRPLFCPIRWPLPCIRIFMMGPYQNIARWLVFSLQSSVLQHQPQRSLANSLHHFPFPYSKVFNHSTIFVVFRF